MVMDNCGTLYFELMACDIGDEIHLSPRTMDDMPAEGEFLEFMRPGFYARVQVVKVPFSNHFYTRLIERRIGREVR